MRADDRSLLRTIKRSALGRELFKSTSEQAEKRMQDSIADILRGVDAFYNGENALDAYAFELMDRALCQVQGREIGFIRQSLRKEIDAKNVLIIERMKKHGADRKKVADILIKGGSLRDSTIRRLMEAKDLGALSSLLRRQFPKLKLKEGASLRDLEIALERGIARSREKAFHRNILSLGVIVSFLLLKEEEVNNLRKIAKGKEFGLSEAEVKETLVVI